MYSDGTLGQPAVFPPAGAPVEPSRTVGSARSNSFVKICASLFSEKIYKSQSFDQNLKSGQVFLTRLWGSVKYDRPVILTLLHKIIKRVIGILLLPTYLPILPIPFLSLTTHPSLPFVESVKYDRTCSVICEKCQKYLWGSVRYDRTRGSPGGLRGNSERL